LKKGQYTTNIPAGELTPIRVEEKWELDLYQAQNAIRIARWTGADKDASDTFQKAENLLRQAQAHKGRSNERRLLSQAARQAVQTAEDARLIALQRQEEAQLAAERQEAADREARARAAAADSARQAELAEAEQRLEAERRARAEAERAAAEAQAERSRREAEIAAREAERDREAARAEVERARKTAEDAEMEKQELRQQLVQQFNAILETRDSARGLIVNMSDVLFDTGKWTLKPGAREKLAKISGIVLAHPGLKLEIEGHTDSVGSDDYNQTLSERRAASVRDFLVQQGVGSDMITARGFGEIQPVASNDSGAGRQMNRRVEMVVSGELIGNSIRPTSRLNPEPR
jgi:outer membrane protein OmpA-like peptidoglycan-associated protein